MKYLNYLFSLQNAGSKYSLDRMKKLIDLLGNPQNKIKTIHIAGSNGKGSCAAFLDSILTEAGYSVGVYTSPHLIRLNERIVVDGVQITDTELEQSVKTIKDIATKHKLEITFFEYITAIAFIYFAYKDVDIAIIEVGLGGRLDATNIITPLVSIITNISLEHTTILGDTKEKIALEKAAIIKQNVPLVTAEQDSTICSLFTKICTESKSMYAHIDDVTPLTENHVGNDIHYFSLTGKIGGTYKIQMQGIHQITNARTALTALTLLPESFTISHDAITAGLFTANWPGRLHVLSENPFILCDGAHNVASMNSLIAYLKTIKNEKSTLLLALSKTKNKEEIVKLIAPLFSKIIVTQSTHMPMDPNLLAEECKKYCDDVTVIENCHDAFLTVKETIPSKGMLCATGSLYLLGDIYTKLSKNGTAKLSTKMSKKNPPM